MVLSNFSAKDGLWRSLTTFLKLASTVFSFTSEHQKRFRCILLMCDCFWQMAESDSVVRDTDYTSVPHLNANQSKDMDGFQSKCKQSITQSTQGKDKLNKKTKDRKKCVCPIVRMFFLCFTEEKVSGVTWLYHGNGLAYYLFITALYLY